MRKYFLLVGLVACGGSDPSAPTAGTSEPIATESAALQAPLQGPLLPPPSGLLLWLRSDTGVTLAADGTVANWHDLTGLGNRDAAPIFGLPGPLYVPDAHHGLPALRGDGTPRSLFVNAGHGYPIGDASTVFLVMSAATDGGGTAGYTFDAESSQGRQYSVVQVQDGSVEWANATNASALAGNGSLALPDGGTGDLFKFTCGLPSRGLHIFTETQSDGISAHGYYDGREVASFVPTGPSVYLMSLMGGPGNAFTTGNNDPKGIILSTGSFNTNGDLVEVLQYDKEKSWLEVEAISAYLALRYGVR
jgi:hypothetical protein